MVDLRLLAAGRYRLAWAGHGSGVSGAIVKRFLDPEGPDQ